MIACSILSTVEKLSKVCSATMLSLVVDIDSCLHSVYVELREIQPSESLPEAPES